MNTKFATRFAAYDDEEDLLVVRHLTKYAQRDHRHDRKVKQGIENRKGHGGEYEDPYGKLDHQAYSQ